MSKKGKSGSSKQFNGGRMYGKAAWGKTSANKRKNGI
jgi:hypothetical protein